MWIRVESDWQQDPDVAALTLAARCVLIDFWGLSVEHAENPVDDSPHATLSDKYTKPRYVAHRVGITADEAQQALAELVEEGRIRIDREAKSLVVANVWTYQRDAVRYRRRREKAKKQAATRKLPGTVPASADKSNTRSHTTITSSNKQVPNEHHMEFIRWWGAKFRERTGSPYMFRSTRDGAHVKDLLGTYGFERSKVLAEAFLTSDDSFIKTAGRDLGIFVSVANKLSSRAQHQSRGCPKCDSMNLRWGGIFPKGHQHAGKDFSACEDCNHQFLSRF
jgi:hypothetical protein